jgi:hypothetical protein
MNRLYCRRGTEGSTRSSAPINHRSTVSPTLHCWFRRTIGVVKSLPALQTPQEVRTWEAWKARRGYVRWNGLHGNHMSLWSTLAANLCPLTLDPDSVDNSDTKNHEVLAQPRRWFGAS